MKPFLLVLSSPSGGGKTSIAKRILATRPDTGYSVSATTRPQRGTERDGVDYHFLSRATFDARVAADEFLEWAEYGGHLYGTLRAEVDRVRASGRHVVLDIEVVGARQLRRSIPEAVHVFILPPSVPVLVERLTGRQTDAAEAVVKRLRHAADELLELPMYDYVVVNDDLDRAVAQVSSILDAEAHRVLRQDVLVDRVEADRAQLLAAAAKVEQAQVPKEEPACGS